MADEKEIVEIEGEEMTVTLDFEDGPVECAIVTILEVEGKEYIVLMPLDDDGEENEDGNVWFYGYEEDKDDPNKEPVLSYIEDDEEFEKVEDAFDEYLDNVEFDEML